MFLEIKGQSASAAALFVLGFGLKDTGFSPHIDRSVTTNH
jgi:hypothetical protein